MHTKMINELIMYIRGENRDLNIDEIVEYYLQSQKDKFSNLSSFHLAKLLISEMNYDMRSQFKSSELVGFKVNVGDICYIDFGKAYISEAGFQHFGIIVGYKNSKALIVPMSSNVSMYNQSYCSETFPNGKRHLYRLPMLDGLRKKSVLFLNDIKYINTARIIEVKGRICPNSSLFKDITSRISTLI